MIKKTILNPFLTLPVLLVAKYTPQGQAYTNVYGGAFKILQAFVGWGVLRVVNNYLTRRALSNGVSDKYDWKKEVVVITGGSDGIGKCVVDLLAEQDIKVAVLDIQSPKGETPDCVTYFKCDISSSSDIAKAASEVRAKLGDPTVLMNIAGVANNKLILDTTEAENRWLFDINQLSHYILAREFVPSMVKNNHGSIISVASLAGYTGVTGNSDYAASKSAVISFHETLTAELVVCHQAPKIRTLLVTPAWVRTPLVGDMKPQGNQFFMYMLEPETLAEAMVKKVLAGESGQIILPGVFTLLVSTMRAMPSWMSHAARLQPPLAANRKWRKVADPNKMDRYVKN